MVQWQNLKDTQPPLPRLLPALTPDLLPPPKHEEKASRNSSVEQRVQDLEQQYHESVTVQHMQATLLYEIQAQVHNISLLVEWVRHNPGCLVPAEMRLQQEMHRPGEISGPGPSGRERATALSETMCWTR